MAGLYTFFAALSILTRPAKPPIVAVCNCRRSISRSHCLRSDDGTSRIKQHETDFRHSSHRRGDGRLGFTRVGSDAALAVGHDRGAGTEDRIWRRCHVSRFRWGQSAELSRKAKADYIFKMMNKLHWEGGRWSGILNFLSQQVFYDDPKYFCKGDDFANFLLQPES